MASDSDFDEDDVNYRLKPFWPAYRQVFKLRGFRLETVRDVKAFYGAQCAQHHLGEDDALCPDLGLPDNLFRGIRIPDNLKVVIKAVHSQSRELDVIRFLSSPPVRDHPMNHCIPVLDLISVEEDDISFIVMEQWSSQLICDESPCCMRLFLSALRQCIEHAAFMHRHQIAHLDISLRNLLTDYKGHYCYIDFEMSRRFHETNPRITAYRGTEVPPECTTTLRGNDPYKIDVWAVAILMLRACQLTGFHVNGLADLVKPMLSDDPNLRPSMDAVLRAFDCMVERSSHSEPSCPTVLADTN